jgi:hypothetical protein
MTDPFVPVRLRQAKQRPPSGGSGSTGTSHLWGIAWRPHGQAPCQEPGLQSPATEWVATAHHGVVSRGRESGWHAFACLRKESGGQAAISATSRANRQVWEVASEESGEACTGKSGDLGLGAL